MSFTENYAKGREMILNRILRADPDSTLNARRFPTRGISGDNSLSREIKGVLNQIKSLVVTENGKVDYQKLVKDPLYKHFHELTGKLQNFDYRTLSTREEKLAFWINIYNALVIDAVIQERIQESVTESWLGILAFSRKPLTRLTACGSA